MHEENNYTLLLFLSFVRDCLPTMKVGQKWYQLTALPLKTCRQGSKKDCVFAEKANLSDYLLFDGFSEN
jgi:hypothetical protein